MGKITREEAKEFGLPTKQGQVYSLNKKTGHIKLISSEEKAFELGLDVSEGQKYKINKSTGKVIKIKAKGGAIKKAKGGIVQVQKFSRGGTVERPRGVGIAKRGFGRVIR